MKQKILLEHLKNCKINLESIKSSTSVLSHTVNIGTAREGFISNFLEDNLPEYISYHSGEIFDSRENKSGQIDLILHPMTSPKLNIYKSINLFPVETVLAVIEVKSNLTTNELNKVLSASTQIKNLENVNSNLSENDDFNVPYIVFAYDGLTEKILFEAMDAFLNKNKNTHFGHLPELVVVMGKNRDYCYRKTSSWQYTNTKAAKDCYVKDSNGDEVLLGLFKYMLELVEKWVSEPQKHTMPVQKYVEEYIDWMKEWE